MCALRTIDSTKEAKSKYSHNKQDKHLSAEAIIKGGVDEGGSTLKKRKNSS